MADPDVRAVAEAFWAAVAAGDWDGAARHLHPDFVQEWPQSGERIRGADNALAVDRNFPGGIPSMTPRGTLGHGDLAISETELSLRRRESVPGRERPRVPRRPDREGDRLLRRAVRAAAVARAVGRTDVTAGDPSDVRDAEAMDDGRRRPGLGHRLPGHVGGEPRAAAHRARTASAVSSARSRRSPTWQRLLLTLSALLILAGALNDYYGRRGCSSIGLVGVRRDVAAVRAVADHGVPDRLPDPAGRGRRAAGAGFARHHHLELRGRGAGPRLRRLGGGLGRHHDHRPVPGRRARQHRLVAHGLLRQRPVPADRVLATIGYVPESRDENASGHFDWLGSLVVVLAVGGLAFGTIRGQQTELGPAGGRREPRRRRRRVVALPVHDAAPREPPGTAEAVPVAQLHGRRTSRRW